MIPLLTRLGFEQSDADPKRWRRRVFARANPRAVVDDWVTIEDSAYAPDDADEVDDWVTIEECGCHTCAPARMNPRAVKRRPEGAYGDIESIAPVIENALKQHGLTMSGIAEVKFTRGGKSRAGSCSYSPSLRQCKIMFNGLAWPAFTEEQRLNTVLHEAAHAIQFLTTGRSDHGPVWTRIAQSIGCSGDRCTTVDESQRMADAYSEARGLPKRKVLTKESAMEASGDFAVGDYVSFEHKRERWYGKIVSKDATHARVIVQQPANRVGVTGKIPYPLLQKEAPPRFAEKTAGVDKPAAGESLTAWQARTGRR
jgi:predicted SprT family Zn-dependent metalloprotease